LSYGDVRQAILTEPAALSIPLGSWAIVYGREPSSSIVTPRRSRASRYTYRPPRKSPVCATGMPCAWSLAAAASASRTCHAR